MFPPQAPFFLWSVDIPPGDTRGSGWAAATVAKARAKPAPSSGIRRIKDEGAGLAGTFARANGLPAAPFRIADPVVGRRRKKGLTGETWFPPCDLHHAAHVGHASTRTDGLLLGSFGHDGLRGQDVLRDRRSVLKRRARDHRRVDDAGLDQVLDLAGVDVQAHAGACVPHLVDDDRRLHARILRKLADRLLERALDDLRARLLVGDRDLVELDRLDRVQERDTATGDDALLERRPGRLDGVLDAVLLL